MVTTYDPVERYVAAYVLERINTPNVLDAAYAQDAEWQASTAELERVKVNLADITKARYIDNLLDHASFLSAHEPLVRRRGGLEAAIARDPIAPMMAAWAGKAAQLWESKSIDERRATSLRSLRRLKSSRRGPGGIATTRSGSTLVGRSKKASYAVYSKGILYVVGMPLLFGGLLDVRLDVPLEGIITVRR